MGRPSPCETTILTEIVWLGPSPSLRVTREGPSLQQDRRAKLVGTRWLKENLHRAGAPQPDMEDYWAEEGKGEPSPLKISSKVGSCPISLTCGRWLPFGTGGWKIAITGGEVRGGCKRYQCLLFDPEKKLFATPTEPRTWKSAEDVKPGACGTIFFDQTEESYLTEGKVCSLKKGCRDAEGDGVGWLPTGRWIVD